MLALREREKEKICTKKNSACNYDYQPICSTLHFWEAWKIAKKQNHKIVAELSRNSSKFAARTLFRSLGTCDMKHEDFASVGWISWRERELLAVSSSLIYRSCPIASCTADHKALICKIRMESLSWFVSDAVYGNGGRPIKVTVGSSRAVSILHWREQNITLPPSLYTTLSHFLQ